MSLLLHQFIVLFIGDVCLGAVIDPSELAALESDPDAKPVDAVMSIFPGVTDGTDVAIVNAANSKLMLVPTYRRADWEATQAKVDAAILALPADVLAAKFAGYVSEEDKKLTRAIEREEAERQRIAALTADAEVAPVK